MLFSQIKKFLWPLINKMFWSSEFHNLSFIMDIRPLTFVYREK